ncbi:MAG: hypothetical protein PHT62_11830 [Desulfotomaculaceae bacterium]|nr:hypothetical protein [Desulfotomaculaceae bacterium]
MQKINLKSIIFGAIFVLGLIILINSVNLGSHETTNIIKANGGSMDTNKYLIYLEQSIIKFRFAGSILSMLGGLGVLISTNIKS